MGEGTNVSDVLMMRLRGKRLDGVDSATTMRHAADRIDTLAARLAEYEKKDGQRTREHNILVRENREQAARLVEVERDAARYEWLRANPAWESEAYLFGLSPDQFDSAVDAAITSSILQHPKSNEDSSG